MGKLPRIETKRRSYRGVSAVPLPQGGKPDEFGLLDLRPMRFGILGRVTVEELLVELVNLPDRADSPHVKHFIDEYPNLMLGETDSTGRKAKPMTPEMVLWLRGQYRVFWEPRASALVRGIVVKNNPQLNKSDGEGGYFQDPKEIEAAIAAMDPKKLKAAVADAQKDRGKSFPEIKASIFMHLLGPEMGTAMMTMGRTRGWRAMQEARDFSCSALRFNWKTARPTILARGPIDDVTHAAFFHRNRLCECSNPNCKEGADGGKKLFIASPNSPNESLCSHTCKLERPRERKKNSATKRRARLRVDGLTSRGGKPKRKSPIGG